MEFIEAIGDKAAPFPLERLANLEAEIGALLPNDYRQFLLSCNGGYIGGALWYSGPTPDGRSADVGVHHVGGRRDAYYYSLSWNRDCYGARIPRDLLWIMDDPFGNAICLGIRGDSYGRIYFWDHEHEPVEGNWDGEINTAQNVTLIASSFTDFVDGLRPTP
jgi:hypothetical protein